MLRTVYNGPEDSHLLNHFLGRRKLFITGRDADESIWLTGRDVEETIDTKSAGLDFSWGARKGRSVRNV